MRILVILLLFVTYSSCWEKDRFHPPDYYTPKMVWGNKPVYSAEATAKQIFYTATALPVTNPGNIYAKGNLIYQLELGKGIHVIDNSNPSLAHRIGFITINGSSQISIKNNFLYSNNYNDLVVIDISDPNNVNEVKRVLGGFPGGLHNYFHAQPTETGYYECPRNDSVVVGWQKDSVLNQCYKN
ncbi:MAG: hypothetical protein ABIO04_00290 [Ferruginibacter sp.]